ncbi:MAG: hypothetical protein DWQ05_03290 [Calditrichaeota bacterium]|nr:MAG: hypothetical protein DWQ05_03290 [Calditrichota bacterium]
MDLGLRFAFSILLGLGIGYWLDQKLALSPLFLILGLVYGSVSGFLMLYRTIYPPQKDKDFQEED